MALDDEIRAVAARQRCIITGPQLADLGASPSAIRHRVSKGSLCRIATNLYCLGGVAIDQELRLRAALYGCGGTSAIAIGSAAAYWSFPGFKPEPIHVLRLRDGTYPPVRFARLHTTTALPDTQLVDRDGLLVTTPARTLFDLAGRIHPQRLERLLDRAWAHRLVNWRIMDRTFRELQSRGRRGIAIMRELLEVRPVDYAPPESNLEGRFRQLLRDDGQAPMERQLNVGDDQMWLGRIDFVDRGGKLIVEVQSDLHHTSISDQTDDQRRITALEDAGWRVHEVSEWDLWHRGDEVQRRIRELRRPPHPNLQRECAP